MGDPEQVPVCAHCGSFEVTLVSLFGGQLMTSQYRCKACLSYFEQIRWEDEEPGSLDAASPAADGKARPQGRS